MNAYIQGFVDKCAECGVDPEQLVKQAQTNAPARSTWAAISAANASAEAKRRKVQAADVDRQLADMESGGAAPVAPVTPKKEGT